MTMIWNEETEQLEFEDGTPVGARPLNEALSAKGKRQGRKHLVPTEESIERYEEGISRDRRGMKRAFKGNWKISKPNQPSHPIGRRDAPVGYRAGILDSDNWFDP